MAAEGSKGRSRYNRFHRWRNIACLVFRFDAEYWPAYCGIKSSNERQLVGYNVRFSDHSSGLRLVLPRMVLAGLATRTYLSANLKLELLLPCRLLFTDGESRANRSGLR